MKNEEIVNKESTLKLLEMFAQTHAMISVLAENRIMTRGMFKAMTDEYVESFERNAMIVLKYIEDLED